MSLKRAHLFLAFVCLAAIGAGCSYFGEAKQVTWEQTRPRALLYKYEWFKDVHAQLAARRASIEAIRRQVKRIEENYRGEKRRDWAPEDLEAHRLRSGELEGMVSAFNDLAARYNAAMVKVNYQFCNVGTMPAGTPPDAEPLPRSVATYLAE